MLAVKFNNQRNADSTSAEWEAFISGLSHKRLIQFNAAVHGDTVRLDTHLEVWSLRSSGMLKTFDFTRIDDTRVRPLVRWLLVKFLASYSVERAYSCFKLFTNKGWTLEDLTLPSLYQKLELCRNEKDGYSITEFGIIKRLADFLISNEAPGTEIEDLYDLEQEVYGMSANLMGYYDMDVRLSPLENQFILTHSTHDTEYIARLHYIELRDFVLLRLCYEIGLRPIQLFRLSHADFQSVTGQYFSIRRPWAKRGRANDHIKGTDKLAISPELGMAIQTLIAQQNNQSEQLLQNEDGSDFRKLRGPGSINNTLARWGAEDISKTPYDFRHNMAHRMVAAGSSASEIAYMLGHTSLGAAKHYIAASPSISLLREKALGRNNTYGSLVALLTGEITLPENWQGETVMGRVGDELATGIGGCDATDCEYVPVHNCYGCNDFQPFEDGHHNAVLDALSNEASKIIVISDSTRQSAMNPAMTQLEGTMEQVKAVISRCRTCQGDRNAK
jgi:integrase